MLLNTVHVGLCSLESRALRAPRFQTRCSSSYVLLSPVLIDFVRSSSVFSSFVLIELRSLVPLAVRGLCSRALGSLNSLFWNPALIEFALRILVLC